MYKDKWVHTQPMGPKSTLRLMRTLGPSFASLAQSTWSLLSNALAGQDCITSGMGDDGAYDDYVVDIIVAQKAWDLGLTQD